MPSKQFPPEKAASLAVESNEAQLRFLFAGLQDAQSVIRATDAKVTALLFGLALPLTKLGQIWGTSSELMTRMNGIGRFAISVVIFLFAISWLVSIAATLRTLAHVDNPAKHVAGERPTGIFYSATLFNLSLWDVFFPRRLDSTAQFSEFFAKLPATEANVRRELAFELMKVIYIRSVKLTRATVAYVAFSLWLVSGGVIWVGTLFARSHGS